MSLCEGINKRGAAFAFELWNAGRIHSEIDRAIEDDREHQSLGVKPGAAEHALHCYRTERCEQFVNEVGIQAVTCVSL